MRLECSDIFHHDVLPRNVGVHGRSVSFMWILCHDTQYPRNPGLTQRLWFQRKDTPINLVHHLEGGTYLPRNKFGMISCRNVKFSNSYSAYFTSSAVATSDDRPFFSNFLRSMEPRVVVP